MRLRILSWNISFAYGPGSDGLNGGYRPRPPSHFSHALESIARILRQEEIDIALLQEVDYGAARSHRMNQLEMISQLCGLPHRSEAVSWDCPYVPYPGLDPRLHFGRVRSGGGILSRFPIRELGVDLLPKPSENGILYNLFYLHRFFQSVEINGIRICNLHLEAFSKPNRALHLNLLAERLLGGHFDLAGGDFNGGAELPAGTLDTWDVLSPDAPTFPSTGPRETLDCFATRKNRFQDVKISVPKTGTVSDHFPVLFEGTFEIA